MPITAQFMQLVIAAGSDNMITPYFRHCCTGMCACSAEASVCACTWMYVCAYVCVSMCVCVGTSECAYACVSMRVYLHVCAYVSGYNYYTSTILLC